MCPPRRLSNGYERGLERYLNVSTGVINKKYRANNLLSYRLLNGVKENGHQVVVKLSDKRWLTQLSVKFKMLAKFGRVKSGCFKRKASEYL